MANFITSATNFLVGRMGINMQGAMVLTVRGRKSGEPRSVVVNPLEIDGVTYLLSPRGETQWVKNARVAGTLTLHRGRQYASYQVTEITDPEVKLTVMRAYLDRWSWQVKSLMGVSKASTDADLRAILGNHPVFVLNRN